MFFLLLMSTCVLAYLLIYLLTCLFTYIFCVQYIDHSKAFLKCVYYINKRRFVDLLHLQVVKITINKYLRIYLFIYLFIYLLPYLVIYLLIDLFIYLLACLLTYVQSDNFYNYTLTDFFFAGKYFFLSNL